MLMMLMTFYGFEDHDDSNDLILTLLGAGGTGGLVLVRGGVKNTPPQNLKISGSEAQHV